MRNKQEIRNIVAGFANSGMTRQAYCDKHNIGISTLDYWRAVEKRSNPKLVEVAIDTQPQTAAENGLKPGVLRKHREFTHPAAGQSLDFAAGRRRETFRP
jgi:hypothetical protein